jgi:uncharacterized protein (DUF4415 family)
MIRTAQKAPKRTKVPQFVPATLETGPHGMRILGPSKQKRGPKPSGNAKVLLTLRVDQDTIAKFKASGDGWQTRMVDALAAAALKLAAPAA